jgi:hypothetical protein
MRGFVAPIGTAALLTLCCCSSEVGNSALKAEQSITASCQAWGERARKAARPDEAMIAQHDALLAKAKKFSEEAQAHYSDVTLRNAAIGNQAQAEIEAAAIYDWKYDLKVAAECWDGLEVAQEIHQQQRARLSAMSASFAAQQPPPSSPSIKSGHSIYPLSTQPPAPPQPSPLPNLGAAYQYGQRPAQVWGQTPCGPLVPPAMQNLPVTSTDPKLPEGCR